MARLLRLFLIFALVATQGTVMAQAVCHHQNAQEHILARASLDRKIASVSIREDAAAVTASNKGSQPDDTSSHWPAEMLPADTGAAPVPRLERIAFQPPPAAPLPSATILPLLKPPSA
jgi:hypothetical protein